MISFQDAEKLLETVPKWILVRQDMVPISLLAANDLARYILELKERQTLKDNEENEGVTRPIEEDIDLLAIPADRQDVASVYLQANLEEALDTMERENVAAIYIFRTTTATADKIYGILTKEKIESHYSYKTK